MNRANVLAWADRMLASKANRCRKGLRNVGKHPKGFVAGAYSPPGLLVDAWMKAGAKAEWDKRQINKVRAGAHIYEHPPQECLDWAGLTAGQVANMSWPSLRWKQALKLNELGEAMRWAVLTETACGKCHRCEYQQPCVFLSPEMTAGDREGFRYSAMAERAHAERQKIEREAKAEVRRVGGFEGEDGKWQVVEQNAKVPKEALRHLWWKS